MKKLLPLFILIFGFQFSSHSQSYKYTLSVGGGVTQSYTDVQNSFNPQKVFHVNADYLLKEFISVGAEFQSGKLVNGISLADKIAGVNYGYFSGYFENNFKQLNLNAKVSLGQFADYKHNDFLRKIRGLYVGAGVGLIETNLKPNQRNFYYELEDKSYDLEGSDVERMISVPINLGIDLYFRGKSLRPLALGINTQINIVPNDRLDGYDHDYNKRKDLYGFTSLSVKYRFGYTNIFTSNIAPR
jgi:hypothetical protein